MQFDWKIDPRKAVAIIGAALLVIAFGAWKGGVRAAEPSWTGCYVSAALGYAIQTSDISEVDLSLATQDITYGVGGGCDAKVGQSNVIVGIMANIDWTKADSALVEWDHMWAVLGRAGLLVSPNTLAYVLAGYTSLEGDFAVPELDDFRGLTLGGGLEVMLQGNWSLRGEYRWARLGSDSMGGTDIDHDQHSFRVALSYRFDTPAAAAMTTAHKPLK